MNMMSVLLGATGLLLVAALALSFGSLRDKTGDPEIQKEIAALKAEVLSLKEQEQQLLAMRGAGATPARPEVAPSPAVTEVVVTEDPVLAAENEALKEQIAELENQVETTERKAETYKDEAGLAWEQQIEAHDKEQRRARIIREALLIATVMEWDEAQGYAIISVKRPENVQTGTILGIRRKGGLLGQLKVAQLYPEEGMATADPHLFPGGDVDVEAGDELIVPPL